MTSPAAGRELADELRYLGRLDREASRAGRLDPGLHQANATRLSEIVLEQGWPGRSLVGEEAADAAFLIALHADHDPEFQRRCLGLVERAVGQEEAPARHAAYLTDRVRVHEGRPQVYGTQLRPTERGVESYPVEDPDRVDERRASVGLEPIGEYLAEAAARLAAGEPLHP